MFRLLVFVFLISPFAFAINDYMEELKDFHQGLAKRQLLLRHQVSRAITQMQSANTPQKKEQVFQKNRSFFKYLLSSLDSMNVNTASKSFIKKGLEGLIEAELKTQAQVEVPSEAIKTIKPTETKKTSNARALKFKNAIKVGGHKAVRPAKVDRMRPQDLFAFAGWGLFALLLGFWAKSFFGRRPETTANSNGALQLKMFKDASTPVIFVNENEHIHWANTSASKELELTKGSSFYFGQELREDEEGDFGHFQDEKGHRYLVERKSARLNGEKYQMLMFIKTSKVSGPKNYRLTEDSLPMGASLSQALEKYNYLYGASGISVSVDQRTEELTQTEKENQAIDRVVYLAYQMAKDVVAPSVKFAIESQKGRKAVQVDIRGLKAESINLSQETFLNQHEVGTLGDLWNELEISLSGQEGRVFMFDKSSGSVPTFSIIVSFASIKEEIYSADASGDLGA